MRDGSIFRQGSLLFFIFCVAVCFPRLSFSFEVFKGEVIANLKLRRSPNLEGQIITVLNKGESVVVKEKKGEWLMVAMETEEYGCRGWVYSEYVKTGPLQKGNAVLTEREFISSRPGDIAGVKSCLSVGMKKGNENYPERQAVNISSEVTCKNRNNSQVSNGYELKSEESAIGLIQKRTSGRDKAACDSLVRGKPEEIKQSPSRPTVESVNSTVVVFIRILLRLSSMILACLALILSYKAFESARACRQTIIPIHE